MVNNMCVWSGPAAGVRWALLLPIGLAPLCGGGVMAQRVDKYFVSRADSAGTLYFVEPMSGSRSATDEAELTFDLTRHTTWEHVTMRFSLERAQVEQVDSLRLEWGGQGHAFPVKRMHVLRGRRTWTERYEGVLPVSVMRAWVNAGEKPGIVLLQAAGPVEMTMSERRWKRLSGRLGPIMQLIDLDGRGAGRATVP